MKLLPCPFCGGEAEQDFSQGYCMYPSGKIDKSAAVYCTECNAHMQLCRADSDDFTDEERMDILEKNWNERR